MQEKPTLKEVLLRMRDYCAEAERAPDAVNRKLLKLGFSKAEREDILQTLVSDGFVNPERFAKEYIRVKSERAGWGPSKIRAYLLQKGIPAGILKNLLEEKDPDMESRVQELALRKWKSLKAEDQREKKQKLMRFLLGRGFPMQLVSKVIKGLET